MERHRDDIDTIDLDVGVPAGSRRTWRARGVTGSEMRGGIGGGPGTPRGVQAALGTVERGSRLTQFQASADVDRVTTSWICERVGSGDGKFAYMSGDFELRTTLPVGPVTVQGQRISSAAGALAELRGEGGAQQPESTPLAITGVGLSMGNVPNPPRGSRELPAWSFQFAGCQALHPSRPGGNGRGQGRSRQEGWIVGGGYMGGGGGGGGCGVGARPAGLARLAVA